MANETAVATAQGQALHLLILCLLSSHLILRQAINKWPTAPHGPGNAPTPARRLPPRQACRTRVAVPTYHSTGKTPISIAVRGFFTS